jgi:hypothetical protein
MARHGKNHALATKYDFVGRCTTIRTNLNQNFVEKLEFLNTVAGLLQAHSLGSRAFYEGFSPLFVFTTSNSKLSSLPRNIVDR